MPACGPDEHPGLREARPGDRRQDHADRRRQGHRHSYLGFTVSPHEECAVEEAVRIVEAQGGSSTVLTLGPEATDQLREAMAVGVDGAILLQTDGAEWSAVDTAAAIADAVRAREAADSRST